MIGLSGCHARDTNISTNNPVIKVSAEHTALDLDPTNNKLKSELASKVMWSYHSDLSDSGVVLDEAVDALYLKKENLVFWNSLQTIFTIRILLLNRSRKIIRICVNLGLRIKLQTLWLPGIWEKEKHSHRFFPFIL